ncbi:hypothetical protein SEA_CHUBSTER_86 [Arthrobacter phage Chubster]|uniref:Uncharacterized protein n=1 Tax=Arthrobacter phage Chubster TaxID=1897527 RepID=A0A1I9SCR0_9CAUD|nr:hypothetical protein SEA_CHUBSTER_86 [Arthrobacter phage Chubster]
MVSGSRHKTVEDSRECLHCGQTRGQVRAEGNGCATVDYEGHCQEDWPQHRWADWKPEEIPNYIKTEAKHKYVRWNIATLQYAACEDTIKGHVYPVTDEDKSFFQAGRCIFCGIEEPNGN